MQWPWGPFEGTELNRSFCNTCGELAPSTQLERDGKVYLVKDCRTCGKTETLIASDAQRYYAKRDLDYGHQYHGCNLNCSTCGHSGLTPSFAFVDVTNRCNMDCPICCDNVPSMGYTFDPPMEYFESLFGQLAQMEPRPTVALFGGEPTAREDLFDIIALSRKHGLKTRVVTNGLKMADPDYCDRLLATRATILLSYDGAHPETYMSLRGSAKSLPLKQKAIENIGKSPNLHAGRIYFITCVARGVNDHEIPELLDFYHSKRKFLSSVHFMPLAHTWKCGAMGFEPERITTEDIEDLVDQVYPDDTVDFIPAGFIAQFSLVSSLFGSTRFPFLGAHPNCESVYMLVSNGERYVPVSHYLRCTLTELGRDLMELEQRLRRWLPAQGPAGRRAAAAVRPARAARAAAEGLGAAEALARPRPAGTAGRRRRRAQGARGAHPRPGLPAAHRPAVRGQLRHRDRPAGALPQPARLPRAGDRRAEVRPRLRLAPVQQEGPRRHLRPLRRRTASGGRQAAGRHAALLLTRAAYIEMVRMAGFEPARAFRPTRPST